MPRKFICVDVGARGGLGQPWVHYPNAIQGVFFDADPDENNELQEKSDAKVLPYALTESCGTYDFNLTKARRCSSFLEPNYEYLQNFPEQERYEVEQRITLNTVYLDYLYEKQELSDGDFLKIDTQGTELYILKGGTCFVNEQVLGIELEVEFQLVYQNQPLFRDVDAYVCEHLGFEFYDLQKYYWKYSEGHNRGQNRGQAIFGNALYFRSPANVIETFRVYDPQKLKEKCMMALFMALAFGYVDYALRLLSLMSAEKAAPDHEIKLLSDAVYKYSNRFHRARPKLNKLGKWLCGAFGPTHEEYATWDSHLGSVKKKGVFF